MANRKTTADEIAARLDAPRSGGMRTPSDEEWSKALENAGGVTAFAGPAHKTSDQPQWLIEQQAAAFREMGPYLDRLQALSQRLGWPLGQLVIRSAVEQLERDHRSAGRSLN